MFPKTNLALALVDEWPGIWNLADQPPKPEVDAEAQDLGLCGVTAHH
ncbi:MAG TPA: hypothetical protein VGI60_04490 [Chthoniobacterales bacterium]